MQIEKACTPVHTCSLNAQEVERQKDCEFKATSGYLLDLISKGAGANVKHGQEGLKLDCFSWPERLQNPTLELRLVT